MVALSRIIIFGNDINGLKDFYQSAFKFPVVEEIENEWVVLNAGAVEIAFHRIGEAYRNDGHFKSEPNTKLVFHIEADIDGFRNSLLEKGVKMKAVKSFEGMNFLFCDGEDIEGNVFQLSQQKV